MPCENCSVQFTVFKRKRVCCECDRFYCSNCIGRGVGLCEPCKILSSRPLGRSALDRLRVRDLQCFLQRQNISTRGCVEKDDLVELVLAHVNSGNFKRKPPTNTHNDFSSTFASLKGFTNNINNLLSSAFDIGSNNGPNRRQQSTASQNTSQFNGTNNSARTSGQPEPRSRSESSHSIPSSAIPTPRSNTVSPRVRSPVDPEIDLERIPESIAAEENENETRERSRPADGDVSAGDTPNRNNTTQTTDCIEIEDIDEGWEMLGQIPDPLPLDSEELIAEVEISPPLRSSARASSEFNLSSRIPTVEASGESSSLNESIFHAPPKKPGRINLQDLKDLSDVECLSVKQLKELLVLNRVDFKGCCERNELLERATRLWLDSAKSREDIDKAPLEELCKICMDAPMECVMLECGHIATCTACGKRLNECPICRQYVTRVVRFFKS